LNSQVATYFFRVIQNNATLNVQPMNSSIVTKAKIILLALQPALNYHIHLNLSSIVLLCALKTKSQTPRIKNVFQLNRIAPMQYRVMENLVFNNVTYRRRKL